MGPRGAGETRAPAVVRVQWVPGTALLAAAIGTGAVLGYTAAAGRPPVYLSIAVGLLILGLAASMLRQRRERIELGLTHGRTHAQSPARPPVDLAGDRRTHSQKYVM